jgi:hypothetical protein
LFEEFEDKVFCPQQHVCDLNYYKVSVSVSVLVSVKQKILSRCNEMFVLVPVKNWFWSITSLKYQTRKKFLWLTQSLCLILKFKFENIKIFKNIRICIRKYSNLHSKLECFKYSFSKISDFSNLINNIRKTNNQMFSFVFVRAYNANTQNSVNVILLSAPTKVQRTRGLLSRKSFLYLNINFVGQKSFAKTPLK